MSYSALTIMAALIAIASAAWWSGRWTALSQTTPLLRTVHRLAGGESGKLPQQSRLGVSMPQLVTALETVIERQLKREAELSQREASYRLMVESATDTISRHTADGIFLYASASAFRLLGHHPDALVGRSVYDLVHPDDLGVLQACHEQTLAEGSGVATCRLRSERDGYRHVEMQLAQQNEADRAVEMVCITRDIGARWEHERMLSEEREKAEAASKAKSAFLANMSHELRTPLNAIIGMSQILRDEMFGPMGSARYIEYARDIESSGQHLLDLINDVVDLSKIEAGHWQLDERAIHLPRTVDTVSTMIGDRARAAEVKLEADLPENLPLLIGDERAVRQILLNLLSNAIKYTPAGGSITVSAWTEPEGIQVRVADTGIGIAPEDIPRALARFGQVDNTVTKRTRGAGLGLTLASDLMGLHGGQLKLESTPDRGTMITLAFPADRTVASIAELAPRRVAG
ncbi:MAG: PAS domain-containing sensor histidine kinase [Proteobacteria bacterium]|nr:PAS domain-containing sensor histidine kinase [Pseudomonadota bacterium]MBI3498553.1 PAS domain-containing sensor histidine kinase [Pseudomonadota bacterium]